MYFVTRSAYPIPHKIPLILFAAIIIPLPVAHNKIPYLQSPEATNFAAFAAKTGVSHGTLLYVPTSIGSYPCSCK